MTYCGEVPLRNMGSSPDLAPGEVEDDQGGPGRLLLFSVSGA
jgi:hypothetical protein